MNFKKLSVIAFAVASFAAQADNLVDPTKSMTISNNASALWAADGTDIGNNAYILQDNGDIGPVTGAIAYISQTGAASSTIGNTAAIMQSDDQALAIVYQNGVGNTAIIATRFSDAGAGDTGTRSGVDISISKDIDALTLLATTELADTPAAGLSELSNVAIVTQDAAAGKQNFAYIDITGTLNLAIIGQTAGTAGNIATIAQVGNSNRAAILQSN